MQSQPISRKRKEKKLLPESQSKQADDFKADTNKTYKVIN